MSRQTLYEAMRAACDAVGIQVPKKTFVGRWAQSPVLGKKASNRSGRVLIFDDQRGGIAKNYSTGLEQPFRVDAELTSQLTSKEREEIRQRQEWRKQREAEEQEVIQRICHDIVQSSRTDIHPYLDRKGFPEEFALIHDDPRRHFPSTKLGELLAASMPEFDEPLLIIPGRVGKTITTIQFITVNGEKKNIFRGKMDGASHRIATGRETWVCEGYATGLSVRAALRALGRSATVRCAFSASNTEKVSGEIVAADNDNPVVQLGNVGTGEFYAVRSGRVWTMPPNVGDDFNDFHQREGLRAVALHLKGVRP